MLLPTAIRINSEVRRDDLARVMTVLTGRNWASPRAAIEAGLDLIEQLLSELNIPRRLADVGVTQSQYAAIVKSSHAAARRRREHAAL